MPSLVAWIHIAQVALILQVVGVAAISKFVIANPPVGRTGMMVFGVSAKSLVIIAYQVFSKKFNKWYSLKANAILNCLEVLFWAAVVFMGVQSHLQSCNGIQCTLGWTVSGLGAVNCLVNVFAAVVSIKIFRAAKAHKMAMTEKGDMEMGPYAELDKSSIGQTSR